MNCELLKRIKCLAYDFDGVMTDNRVLVSENGLESVFCNRGDGLAIAKLKELGLNQVIVSTEENPVVKARANKLKIEAIYGCKDKAETLKKYCDDNGIDLSETMFIGNDINDLSVMNIVGLTGAPKDAEKKILDYVDWTSTRNGGEGVIRELYDIMRNIK